MNERKPGWDEIVSLWQHSKPASTLYVYLPVLRGFRNFIADIPPHEVTLKQFQDFITENSKGQLPATVKRKISTIRSVFRFARRIGAIERDVTEALLAPRVPDELANRIITKDKVLRMIDEEPERRNRVLLIILFSCGVRASEAANLKWCDCRQRTHKDGQLSVLGKGNKRRSIRLTPDIWEELISIRPADVSPERFIFESEFGFRRPLSRTRIAHIVRAAAKRAGLEEAVSPHWMRHAHASTALDSGAPLSLISATLGHSSVATTARYLHANPEKSSTQYIAFTRKKAHKT